MRQIIIVVLVFGLVLSLFVSLPEDKVVFMDVGQGDSILLQDGMAQVLIDGGPGMEVLQRLGEELPWFDRRIELVILTHPERDHLEGLLHVLKRYEVGAVLFPEVVHDSQMYEKWLELLEEKNIDYRFAWSQQQVEMGEVRMTILGPIVGENGRELIEVSKMNNASVMMKVDYGEMSFLLTGDAEKSIERKLVSKFGDSRVAGVSSILDVDILKAGHHGSNTSTHDELIKAASPSAAVISVGGDNKYGHPRSEVLERLGDIPVWRTDEMGSVRFTRIDNEWLVNGR